MLLEKCGALNDIKHSDIECFTSGDFFRLRDLPPSDDDEIKGCIPVQAIEVSLISYAFGQPFSKCAEDVYTKNETLLSCINSKILRTVGCTEGHTDNHDAYNQERCFDVENDSIEEVISSSSLMKASGNIERLSNADLQTLKTGVSLYHVNEQNLELNKLVNELIKKIDDMLILHKNADLLTFFKSSPQPSPQSNQQSAPGMKCCVLL